MTQPALLVDVDGHGTASVVLNRPRIHNAFDDALIGLLSQAFDRLGGDDRVRAVVLSASGANFSAGADVNWMRRMAANSDDENRRDALAMAAMMEAIDHCPKPVIGLVQGAALGGGVGLVACCDMAVAAEGASFALSEVRLGIIPAVISPFVLQAIGARAARRYFLTAERFGAAEALRIGLVHEVVPADGLAAARDRLLAELGKCGPQAVAASKDLVRVMRGRAPSPETMTYTAGRIAEMRASPEGREGLSAFLEKRKPAWVEG